MDRIMQGLPRVCGFFESVGFRKFTFGDVNQFLEKNLEKPLTGKERFVLASLVDNRSLFKAYRQREKSIETVFWLGEVV